MDKCFCTNCARLLKDYLEQYKGAKVNEEKMKIGITTQAVGKGTQSKNLKSPFIRILKEDVHLIITSKYFRTLIDCAPGASTM